MAESAEKHETSQKRGEHDPELPFIIDTLNLLLIVASREKLNWVKILFW